MVKKDRDRSKLPLPELPFRGKIGKTYLGLEPQQPNFGQDTNPEHSEGSGLQRLPGNNRGRITHWRSARGTRFAPG